MKVSIPVFKGLIPRQSSRLLPDGYAVTATNCRLLSGDLTPWKQPSLHALSPLLPASALQSIYKFQQLNGGNDVFMRSVDDVDWAKGIIAGDTSERIYFTGFRDNPSGAATPAVPKVTNFAMATGGTIHSGQTAGNYPNNWFFMGVPTPTSAPGAGSVPIVSNEVLISDGSVTTPWTPTTNLTANSSGVTLTGAIKMTDPANTHTASDPGVGDANGDTIRFDFEVEEAGSFLEFRFGCDSLGNGPAIRILVGDSGATINPTLSIGTVPTWTGTYTNTETYNIPNVRPQEDDAYRCNVTITVDGSVTTATIIITRISNGSILVNRDYEITPLGTYLGFRTDDTATSKDAWFDNVYTASAAATDDVTTTNYIYTWINELGEESAPSPASSTVDKSTGLTTTVSSIADPSGYPGAGDALNYGLSNTDLGTKRLYRASTGADGATTYLFVADIDYGTTTYEDEVLETELGEALPSEEWDLPPSDGHSILSLPNGITVIASKNEIFPSETNQPHASLPDYSLATDHDIVGMGAIDSTVVVLTEANPYLVVGSDPRALSMAKLEVAQGCVSKRSIASVGGFGVIYATPDGLAAISGNGVQLITQNFFTREQWQALVPTSIFARVHDDKYFFWYNTGSVKGGYVFDIKEGTLTEIDLSIVSGHDNGVTAGYSNPLTDVMYFVHSTNKLSTWNSSATDMQYTWKSKVYQFPYKVNLEAGQTRGTGYGSGVTYRLYGDGSSYFTKTVTEEGEFILGLPTHGAHEVQLELIGTAVIEQAEAAEDMMELY